MARFRLRIDCGDYEIINLPAFKFDTIREVAVTPNAAVPPGKPR